MVRLPPSATRTDTLLPSTTLFRFYRYRLAVEVATPEGLRSGSSVIEVQATRGIGLFGPEAGEISLAAHGEAVAVDLPGRSEEHTSELQSLMRISYAVFCLKKKNKNISAKLR